MRYHLRVYLRKRGRTSCIQQRRKTAGVRLLAEVLPSRCLLAVDIRSCNGSQRRTPRTGRIGERNRNEQVIGMTSDVLSMSIADVGWCDATGGKYVKGFHVKNVMYLTVTLPDETLLSGITTHTRHEKTV